MRPKKWIDRRGLTLAKLSKLSELPLFDVEQLLLQEAALGELCALYGCSLDLHRALRLLPVLMWLEEEEGHISDVSVRIVCSRYEHDRCSDTDVLVRHGILDILTGRVMKHSRSNTYRLSALGRKMYHTYISTYGNLRADLMRSLLTSRK